MVTSGTYVGAHPSFIYLRVAPETHTRAPVAHNAVRVRVSCRTTWRCQPVTITRGRSTEYIAATLKSMLPSPSAAHLSAFSSDQPPAPYQPSPYGSCVTSCKRLVRARDHGLAV